MLKKLLLSLAITVGLALPAAANTITVTFTETSSGVTISGDGSVDTSQLIYLGPVEFSDADPFLSFQTATFVLGGNAGTADLYGTFDPVTLPAIGSGQTVEPSVGTGIGWVLRFFDPVLAVPFGYVSGDNFSFENELPGASIASLGLFANPPSSTFGPVTIDYVVNPIPLPAAGWMLLAGVGGLVAASRKRRRAVNA